MNVKVKVMQEKTINHFEQEVHTKVMYGYDIIYIYIYIYTIVSFIKIFVDLRSTDSLQRTNK